MKHAETFYLNKLQTLAIETRNRLATSDEICNFIQGELFSLKNRDVLLSWFFLVLEKGRHFFYVRCVAVVVFSCPVNPNEGHLNCLYLDLFVFSITLEAGVLPRLTSDK
jgi:hypothetical protein